MKAALVSALFLFAITGCKPEKASEQKEEKSTEISEGAGTPFQDEHNSRNSLDWNGTYQGTLPCADCDGIKIRLTLTSEGEFNRTRTYLGKEEFGSTDSGTFEWNEAGSEITLRPLEGDPQGYQVGENRLFFLDREGKRITGQLAAQYVLVKNRPDYQLENKKWILTELMGKEIEAEGDQPAAFLYFDRETARVSGNNSCNAITGTYELKAGNRIVFGRLASTMMACPDMETPDQFNEVLERADNYAIADGVLSLNKARMAPMARFRLE